MWYPMRIKVEESRERSRLLERVTDIREDAGRPTFSERKVSSRREKKEVWYLRGK